MLRKRDIYRFMSRLSESSKLGVGGRWDPFGVSGFQGFRVSGFQGFRVSGFQGFRVSGFQGFRVSGFQGFRVSFSGRRFPNLTGNL